MPDSRRRFRITVAVVAACCLLPLAYSVFTVATHRPSRPAPAGTPSPASTRPSSPGSRASGPSVTDMALQVMPAPYQLPDGLSREVLLPGAGGLLIAGGLTPQDTSTDAVTSLDPVTGATHAAGHLAAATHDAAGAASAGSCTCSAAARRPACRPSRRS